MCHSVSLSDCSQLHHTSFSPYPQGAQSKVWQCALQKWWLIIMVCTLWGSKERYDECVGSRKLHTERALYFVSVFLPSFLSQVAWVNAVPPAATSKHLFSKQKSKDYYEFGNFFAFYFSAHDTYLCFQRIQYFSTLIASFICACPLKSVIRT